MNDLAENPAHLENQRQPMPSYPLDLFLWLVSPLIDSLVNSIANEIKASEPERNKRSEEMNEKFLFSVKIIILNLMLLSKLPIKTALAIRLSAGAYTFKTRYDQRAISYRAFKDAYDGLITLNYIQVKVRGHWDDGRQKGRVTRIVATAKLNEILLKHFPNEMIIFTRHPDEETIRLKNERKRLMDYTDNPYTNQARSNLKKINACLNRHWFDLNLNESQFSELYERVQGAHTKDQTKPPVINFSSRNLYRVYNNGNKDAANTFTQGGRFYGAWWESIPSEYRKNITINDKHTVEVDYSSLHPHMLYGLVGIQLKADPYAIDSKIPRDWGKVAFQQLINGKGGRLNPPDGFSSEEEIAWKEVVSLFRNYHAPISKYFDTGYGLELQLKDSEIVEKVLLHFAERDIPCLPVHDSLIIHYACEAELKEVMLYEYQKAMKGSISLKDINGYDWFVKSYKEHGENKKSIEEILNDMNSSQYQRRIQTWYDYLGDK